MKRALLVLVATVVVLVVVATAAIQLRWQRTFPAPATDLHASTDSGIVARGGYLIYGPAKCAGCHVSPAQAALLDGGERVPLAGGNPFALPFGTFRVPNLTPDSATGIGARSDAQLVQMIRYGVRHDGRAALPFMEFQDLADDDLVAIISFLRAQPAVRNPVAAHTVSLPGRALYAFVLEPRGPSTPPPAHAPTGATVRRGEYLVRAVAECASCHSQRSLLTGAYTGPLLAGGNEMEDEQDPRYTYVTPNLTPDPATGRITGWTETQFIDRFRRGRVYASSHMPWESFNRMTDDDLRAIHRYLHTVPPVVQATGASRRLKR